MDYNLDKIKNRLESLKQTSKPKQTEKKDYTLVYWKPKAEGKYQIRFLKSNLSIFKHREELIQPFQEVLVHYGIGKYPIVSLINYWAVYDKDNKQISDTTWANKDDAIKFAKTIPDATVGPAKDPIVEFCSKLRDKNKFDAENWRLAKQLDPKLRVFAPIIVRGEEEKGVRLFEFSKTIYEELLNIYQDEDYGNYIDIAEGFDFVVNASKVQDRPGFALSLRPKPRQTPLSEDASQIQTWLDNQPNLLEEKYKYTYDKLKEELQNFISGGEEKEDDIISEPAVGFEDGSPAKEEKKFTLSTQGTPKKAKSEEFDSLFEDDLPF